MFVSMGLSAIVPVLHGLRRYGLSQMRLQIGLSWLVLQGMLYVLGAGIYAVILVSCPAPDHPKIDQIDRAECRKNGSLESMMCWAVLIRSSTSL